MILLCYAIHIRYKLQLIFYFSPMHIIVFSHNFFFAFFPPLIMKGPPNDNTSNLLHGMVTYPAAGSIV